MFLNNLESREVAKEGKMKTILGYIIYIFIVGTLVLLMVTLSAKGLECYSTSIYYQDNDKDGYGNNHARTIRFDDEAAPSGYATKGGDCDDSNPTINPGAEEIAGNAIDENCDGITDPQKAKRK